MRVGGHQRVEIHAGPGEVVKALLDRRAQELTSIGIGPGAWLGVMLGNVPEFVILAAAASKIGAVFVPLDPVTTSRELDMILEAAPLRALITRPHGGDAPTPTPLSAPRGDTRASTPRHQPESRRRLQGTLLNVHLYKRFTTDRPSDCAGQLVLFTSDSGGDPKGVGRTDEQLQRVATMLETALELRPAERVLSAVPLHQAFGFDAGLLAPLSCGASLYLEDELSIKRLSKLLRDEHMNVVPGNPALYGALVREVTAKPLTTKRPRFLSSGASLPPPLATAFFERYGVRLLSTYHSTETGPVSIDMTGENPTTVGRPFDGVEVRIAAEAASGHGVLGGVWVRSAAASKSFLPELSIASPRASAAIGRPDQEGWLRTGDVGAVDEGGRLILSGREDDLVKIDGKRVALGEVAACLEGFAKVKEAEARLTHDELGNAIIVARVISASPLRTEDLVEHCARHLAPHKVPRQIEIAFGEAPRD